MIGRQGGLRLRSGSLLVVVGVIVALATEAYALFAGSYLPYIDWSNHLAHVAIMAFGEETGALEYAERSLSPRPYLLFFVVAAGLSFVVSVAAAAKLAIVASAGLSVVAMAWLARTLERPLWPALLAPLVLYGYPRGYGFSSFVFTVPFVLLVLASFEALLRRLHHQRSVRGAAAAFSACLVLCYLGHALWALPAGLALAVRWAVFAVGKPVRTIGESLAVTVLAGLPAVLCAAIAWTDLGPERSDVTVHRADIDVLIWGTSLTRRWSILGGHLLERGSPAHWYTMYGVAALFLVFAAWHLMAWARKRPWAEGGWFTEADRGAVAYAGVFGLLYAVGPESIGWPVSVWMIYPRYGTMAGLLVFLLWRPPAAGRWGSRAAVALGAVALALVAHNAHLNHGHVKWFSSWAQRYDVVRSVIPPKSTVLALTGFDPGDWIASHPAFGSLYFYHLCDGAAYTAFLFDQPMHPVRLKPKRPPAPPWNNTSVYSPTVHGEAFDYLVLRGRQFVRPTERAGRHDVVLRHDGWVVFKTKTRSQ